MAPNISRRQLLRGTLLTGAGIAGTSLLAACGSDGNSAPGTSDATTQIRLQLDWLPLGRFAGFYHGVESGLYAEKNLDVKLASGTGTGTSLQQLSVGKAEFTFVKVPSMMRLLAKNPNPVMRSYGVLHAKYPATFFFFGDGPITSPKDLEGKRIAASAGSDILDFMPLFAQRHGVDASKIKWEMMAPASKVSALLTGQVDATTTDLMGLPSIEAGANGRPVKRFTFGEMNVDLYGNGLIGREDWVSANTEAAKAFVQATIQAHEEAFAQPEQAVEAMAKSVKELDRAQAVAEVKIIAELARTADQQQHGLGYQAPGPMQASYDAVTQVLGEKITKPVEELYSNDLLAVR